MIFTNGGDLDWFRDWNGPVIAKDGPDISYLSTHSVVSMNDLLNKSAGRDAAIAADFAAPVAVANYLGPAKEQIDSNPGTRGRVKIAYTEWLFHAPEGTDLPRWDNLGGAFIAGGWMNMIRDHSDFVPVSDMTGLLEFAGIYKRKGRVFVTPQYWAFSLYSTLAGDRLVETKRLSASMTCTRESSVARKSPTYLTSTFSRRVTRKTATLYCSLSTATGRIPSLQPSALTTLRRLRPHRLKPSRLTTCWQGTMKKTRTM